jgi:DNA repair protein SbcC/Rad50
MRILRLHFMNLNSLAGEWAIDFTHPDYVTSGIFAITGPTGAGKSTILDGICLALYGQTPRLGKITQSGNQIMSRQLGECSAEVEFETARGRFRCHWSQHRARKQAHGKLQSPRHEIAEAGSGQILESKLTAVAGKVEEVTGMDFERFTRSMLLAQGSFAAFLQARPDERAPILEQVTGTAIYSRVSIMVHERTSVEREKLKELRAELLGIQLLSADEEAGLWRELAEKQQQEITLAETAVRIRASQAWLERIAMLEHELVLIEQACKSFEEEKAAAVADLEQLVRAGCALSLAGDYAGLEAVRRQQAAELTDLAVANERLPKVQRHCKDAAELLEKAEVALQNANAEQAREAELIRSTRALDVKLDEAGSQVRSLQGEVAKLMQQQSDYHTIIVECEKQTNVASTALRSADIFLGEHMADASLIENLTGIGQQVKALKALEQHCSDRSERIVRQAVICQAAGLALEQAETALRSVVQAVSVDENQLAVVRAGREAILRGHELSAWRAEAEALMHRQIRLEALRVAATRLEETSRKLDGVKLRMESLEHVRQTFGRQAEELTGELCLREELSRQLQEKLLLLNRVRDLEVERAQLVDGAPCPLCGATEHPYAFGNVPLPDDAQQELEQARLHVKELADRLSVVNSEQAGVNKELEQAALQQSECLTLQHSDILLCRTGFADLGLPEVAEGRFTVIDGELVLCREALIVCKGVILEAEQAEEGEKRAKAAFDKARDVLTIQDKARHGASLGYETAVNERHRLEQECVDLQADLDRALTEVERAVDAYGCRDITLVNIDEMFAELTGRRIVFTRQLQGKERLEKDLADLCADKEKQQALLAETERNLADWEQLLRIRLLRQDELTEQRKKLYGERNPDLEEKRLADVVQLSGAQRDAVLHELNRHRTELAGLDQQIHKLTASVTTRTSQLAVLEPALLLRITESGFSNEADFLQACLPRQRFDELTLLAENLRRKETEIIARRQDRSVALEVERDKKLSFKTIDQLKDENVAATHELTELQKALGALGQKLGQHVEQQLQQQSRLQAVESQKVECARWECLHELIGSADGKKFRNFAQGLTFELMVAHANRQLRKMSDRYILVRDNNEPLELNVIDNYQAGEIRSTKNLSGGESFIASLALSLGLSGMASRNVRVDSLFLDEGFGTLDEDALETALETLSGLQQDGKLIGIISHVPALKERIGVQIQVDVGNAGRSSIAGPGCRRII